jgi:hypothetical protein
MGLVKPSAVLVVLFLTGLANGPSPAAADNKIQLKPGATRPGGDDQREANRSARRASEGLRPADGS